MVTIVRWFVRLILFFIVIDWLRIKWVEDGYISPAGMIMIDLESQTVAQCVFGCSAEDLNENDIVPMEIRFVTYEESTSEPKAEEKED